MGMQFNNRKNTHCDLSSLGEFLNWWAFHVYDISVDINKREEERLHRADG